MWYFWRELVGQRRALANARSASRALTRERVEREEVRLFLDELEQRGRGVTRR